MTKIKLIGKNSRIKLLITYYSSVHRTLWSRYEYDGYDFVLQMDFLKRRLELIIEIKES